MCLVINYGVLCIAFFKLTAILHFMQMCDVHGVDGGTVVFAVGQHFTSKSQNHWYFAPLLLVTLKITY